MTLLRKAVVLSAVLSLGGLAYSLGGDPDDTRVLGPLHTLAGGQPPFEARVIERVPAGSYTYFQVEREDRSREWVVTLAGSPGARAARTSTRLKIVPIAYAARFESKRLARVFDHLHFAMVRAL